MKLAIIDLGSNSFKIDVSRAGPNGFKRLASLKTPVRFIAGIDAGGKLNANTSALALVCLASFRALLDDEQPDAVAAIATESMRRLEDRGSFLAQAQAVLGVPIRVLTGSEEAAYCFAGVEHLLGKPRASRLVMDIGGGSTQFILGDQSRVLASASVRAGCVVVTRDFFAQQMVTQASLARAVGYAADVYSEAWAKVNVGAPKEWVGASGAFRTVLEASADVAAAPDRISRAAMTFIEKKLISRGTFSAIDFPSVPVDRHPVFIACFALTQAVFEVVQPPDIEVCKSGLRMGLLNDLAAKVQLTQLRA